jgi:hypothetical protein
MVRWRQSVLVGPIEALQAEQGRPAAHRGCPVPAGLVYTRNNTAGAAAAALLSVMSYTYSNHSRADREADGVDAEAASV